MIEQEYSKKFIPRQQSLKHNKVYLFQ